jgi:ABC-type nitrate/sulfonate/bicarbonate transport system substrate-binding protein
MSKKLIFAIIAPLIIVLGVVFILWPRPPKGYSGPVEPITIGRPVSDSGTIIFTAEDQHLFAANGIKLTQKTYDTGLAAINGLLNNEIDFSGSAEYPFVVKAFENASISIIASFARTYNEYVVGPIDKGIRNEADLRGKRVGLPRGGSPGVLLWPVPGFARHEHQGRYFNQSDAEASGRRHC